MSEVIDNFFENRQNNIVDTDWWKINFIKDFIGSESETKKLLNEKRMKLSNKFISSRVLTHWQKRGLITDERPDGKGWRKFSPSEVIWIGIIIKLRKFGMDFGKIKKVKEYLEFFHYMDTASKFPELDFYIINGFNPSQSFRLFVFESGESIFARKSDIDFANTKSGLINEDYISIDITKMFYKGVGSYPNDISYLDFGVTPIESEIRKTLSLDGIKSLSIRINNDDEYIINKEIIQKSKKEFEAIINKLNYCEAITIKRGGKKYHKIIESKKIKK